jgi:hypothetical protein
MFIGRAELLPEDETVQEHQTAKEDEASLLAADRAGRGLFKGVFLGMTPTRLGLRDWRRGILDPEDNVMRCPDCHWEMEDGGCNRCGFHEFDLSESDVSNSDDESIDLDDSEMDSPDEVDHEFGATMGHAYGGFSPRLGYPSHLDVDDDDEDEDDDMDGFIDNEADEGLSDSGADTESTMTLYNRQWQRNQDDHASTSSQASAQGLVLPHFGYHSHFGNNESPAPTLDEEPSDAGTNYDEMTEDSDPDPPTPTHPPRRQGAVRVILSSDDEDEEDRSEAGETNATDHDEDEDDDDEDDDDSELSLTEASHEAGASDSDEESDDSIRPPQSSSQRRYHQHPSVQRARQGGYNPHQGYRSQANPPFNSHGQQPHPPRQYSHRGRREPNRYQPYQRPFHIAVGGNNREYNV